MQKLLKLTDLIGPDHAGQRMVPVSKATLYRMIQTKKFPKPRKIGWLSVWREQDIELWHNKYFGGDDANTNTQ